MLFARGSLALAGPRLRLEIGSERSEPRPLARRPWPPGRTRRPQWVRRRLRATGTCPPPAGASDRKIRGPPSRTVLSLASLKLLPDCEAPLRDMHHVDVPVDPDGGTPGVLEGPPHRVHRPYVERDAAVDHDHPIP